MKREDVKNKIPGITDEQLNWIMQENGAAGVAVVSTGAEHGAPPANDSDGVEAAFKSLNPELNL